MKPDRLYGQVFLETLAILENKDVGRGSERVFIVFLEQRIFD
ncbi:hypothetical protein AB9M62_45070 [Bacillales bacterium AN1005]